MFTDLAFIDWIALIFAALLLAAAAAAGLVAYATTKSRQKMPQHAAELRPSPAHAAPPKHAVTTEASYPAPEQAVREITPAQAVREATPAPKPVQATTDGPPAPPILVSTPKTNNAVMSDGVRIEPSNSGATPEDTVAARAAKLRGRPTPESTPTRKRLVSLVEPGRTPAHAPNGAFVGAHERSGVSIEMDRSAGFSARTPGFFEDPVGRHELRYWDGHRWTEYVKEHGERFTDPL